MPIVMKIEMDKQQLEETSMWINLDGVYVNVAEEKAILLFDEERMREDCAEILLSLQAQIRGEAVSVTFHIDDPQDLLTQ